MEYVFLFVLAGIWTLFAVVQDLKTTIVSDWLSYSLVGIALAYRAFYSSINNDWMFFVYGVLGFAVFFVLAYGFYYTRTFGGGDAGLLIGYGVILPFTSYFSLLYLSVGFILVLFLVGAVWNLFYSFYLVSKDRKRFFPEFGRSWKENKIFVFVGIGIFVLSLFFKVWYLGIVFLLLSLVWVYVRGLDKGMIVLKSPDKLIEGDWILEDIKVGNKIVRKSVHGLSRKDIVLLKRSKKKVYIKDGIPFTPAFLGALIAIWILQIKGFSLRALLSYFLA